MALRRRRAHTKSRRGCGNCKIRRVKCDEARPGCMKCESYGVSCNYHDPDKQLVFGGDLPMDFSANESILDMFNFNLRTSSCKPMTYNLGERDLELLNLFQTQTVYTIGTTNTVHVYQNEVVREAGTHPWLMHVLLAFASMHKRALQDSKASADEEFHWLQGATGFREILTKPIRDEDRDALWATAALLGASSFFRVDAVTPEEAWPLNPNKDLGWLGMSDGKKAIWKLADVGRPDSVFHDVFEEHQQGWSVDWTLLPPNFKEAGIEGMPYQAAASTIANLLQQECNHGTILRFLAFITRVQPEYKELLQVKDARALLILSYWYAKVCTYNQWWVRSRAKLECQAICIYLERYHAQDVELMKLLQYPKMMCGLVSLDHGLADERGRPTTPLSMVDGVIGARREEKTVEVMQYLVQS